MEQPALFHETVEDALSADIAALGGPKKCASWLFGHLDPNQGAAMVRACLNPERNERLSPEQVMQLKDRAAQAGSFSTILYEAQRLGYKIEWISPTDEADALRREIRDLLKVVNQRQTRLERVETKLTAA